MTWSADAELPLGLPTVAVVHQSSGGHVRPLLPLVAALRARGARTVQWALPEWEAECATAGGEEPALASLGDDEELVYVSLGTVFEERPAFFRDAARALARPGRRVVLSAGRITPRALGTLPAGVTAHAHVDQLAVLRRADLFITHGGFNSVQEGLVAGVPMLVFPQMQEQVLNADRVSELGAGLRLRRATAARIGAWANLILGEPRFRAVAGRTGAELRTAVDLDGAVDAVLGAAAGHHPASSRDQGVP